MAKSNKPPSVRLGRVVGRCFQLRYTDPETQKEIRISTKTHNEAEAMEQKADLEAKLRLGIEAKPKRRAVGGANMPWQDFRDAYTRIHVSTLKDPQAVEYRLDVIERILSPRNLGDVANAEALHDLQSRLLAGEAPSRGRKAGPVAPRSPHSVRTTMAVVLAALNWAAGLGWIEAVPRIKRLKTSKLKAMKGRPLTASEFAAMLRATRGVVGVEAARSWRLLLRGLWESGLRLGELLAVHWSDPRYIVPTFGEGLPTLAIPATRQKNATEESIPLLPGFERLLLRTPAGRRRGFAFNPQGIRTDGRKPRQGRPSAKWASKIVTRIGKASGVIVSPATPGKPAKHASSHDLRRSLADRLIAAGVLERDVAAIMRHANVATTRRFYAPENTQRTAEAIRQRLATAKGT
ncbi:tyrosine-type recombinase/integrase [Lacipirellula limnantheis]|uniref:Site-specific tyrosine recombinase XerC n=1 Tax=Lacipirellula limnantheis TaxID=2528024 RepID=A0A517U073_9BACT|nr:site-specific integrase [Lacipirellula limnantheis]QDT74026.1 site-specific tyrosine recombinase XerC [Lacipirellula limnantheis]